MKILANIYIQLTSVSFHKGFGPSKPKIKPSGVPKTTPKWLRTCFAGCTGRTETPSLSDPTLVQCFITNQI